MARLNGSNNALSWLWLVVAVLLLVGLLLGLDYIDILPLHLY